MKRNLPISEREIQFPDAVNILSTASPKGIITHVNNDFLRISGFERDELINKNHNAVRHPDVPESVFAHMWDTIKSGKSWMGVVKNRAKNGDHYWVDAYVTPIERHGEIVEYQSVRRKPDAKFTARAQDVFNSLNAGKAHQALKPSLSFCSRIALIIAIPCVALLIGALAIGLSPTWLLATLAIVVSSMGALFFVLQPMMQVIKRAHRIIDNPVARFIYTGRTDDVGQILLALRALEAETAGLIGRIADSSHILQESAEELTNTVNTTSNGIEQQFSETEHIAGAVTQMSASIHEVANRAQQAADIMEKSQQQIHISQTQVQHTVHDLKQLTEDLNHAAHIISELQHSSTHIMAMLGIINAVSEQTNLLALNAAIEAARAGDAGQGFAVVADEVRQLASRTRISTDEIQHIIDTLQQHSKEAVNAMQRGREQANSCLKTGHDSLKTLASVCEILTEINDMNMGVANAMEEQSTASDVIAGSMNIIRNMSETNLAAEHVSQAATKEVLGVTYALNSLANNFWTKSRNKKPETTAV